MGFQICQGIGPHQLVLKTEISYIRKRDKETTIKSRAVEVGLIEVSSLKKIFAHQKKFLGSNPQCIPDVSIDPCQESIFCYTGQSRLIDMQEEQQIMVSHTIYYSRMIVQIWNSSKKIMIWIPICELGDFQHCFSVFEHGRTESRACCKLNMIL